MSGRIVEYKIVCSDEALSFGTSVNGLIKEGWKLYGTPFSNGEYFCQAMVKEVAE